MLRRLLLTNIRRQFSTSSILSKSYLSEEYKSPEIWQQRFKCPHLNVSEDVIKAINNKILSNRELTNLEVDIFINIATGSKDDIAQLKEANQLIQKLRASTYAHTLLPSTQHAICRLFLSAGHIQSLITILDQRVRFGIFPDFFTMNLLLNECLDKDQLANASKLASLVMIQEEFGMNPLTDAMSALSVVKYLESKTDFSDWPKSDTIEDPMFTVETIYDPLMEDQVDDTKIETKNSNDEGDEEEEDVQYVRIPWLRNSYDDHHFDLNDPKLICGKTCLALGDTYMKEDEQFGNRLISIGKALYEGAEKVQEDALVGLCLAAEGKVAESKKVENDDIEDLRRKIDDWSDLRRSVQAFHDTQQEKENIIEEMKRKKKEIQLKEQYLYFYDDLKKRNLTRLEYE